MKRLVNVGLIFGLQIAVFLLVHELTLRVAPLLMETNKTSINWGITLKFAAQVFYILALLEALIFEFLQRKNLQYFALFVIVIVFLSLFASSLKYTPYRTALLFISAILGFVAPILLKRFRINNNK